MQRHYNQSLPRRLTLLLVGLLIPALSWGATIKGTILDETGEPLTGATVLEKGTSNAVATDIDGNFTLVTSSATPTLLINFIGYEPVTMKAKAGTPVKVTMKPSSTMLDDVVVVAYGTQKKVSVTGAIASVDNAEIKKSSAPNLTAALAGKLPGLTTIQTNGAPGKDEVNMYLRGAATYNDTNPLILVDGVPRESIRDIDANEIQSISVLKDASATAVFGVRGANGVILITTRRGEQGKAQVSGSVQYSQQSFARKPYRRDSWDYARLLNESRANEGMPAAFSDDELALFDAWKTGGPANASDAYWYPNTNWSDILFKDHSSMVQANANVSGGTDKVQYFVNAGYVYQGGMYNCESKEQLGYNPQAQMNRYNLRSNIDYKFSQWVKASLDLSSFIEKVNGTNREEASMWADAITARPTTPGPLTIEGVQVRSGGTGDDGSVLTHDVVPGQVIQDPAQSLQPAYGLMNRAGYNLATRSGINAIGTLTIDLGFLTQGLSIKGLVSYQSRSSSNSWATKNFVVYQYERNPSGLDFPIYTFDGSDERDDALGLGRSVTSNWFLNLQAQVNYNRTFNKVHNVTGMLLFQRDKREGDSGDIPYNMIGTSARFTYNYDSRYLAEVDMGYNGTEQFAPKHRFGFFPAFSLGWVISNEPYINPYTRDWLDMLKLRASIGKVGNDGLGSTRFLYLDNVNYYQSATVSFGVPSLGNAYKISEVMLGNPDIHWETAWKYNYGVDLTLFRNLHMAFDYFIENRSDILIARNTVPMISGMSSSLLPRVNKGKIRNKGYELTGSYYFPVNKDLNFTVNGSVAYNTNKVLEADESILAEDYAYRYRSTGFMLGQCWGYVIDHTVDPATGRDGSGFFNSEEDIALRGLKYEIEGGSPLPGDFIYKDLNGDGVINDRDQAPIGYSSLLPKYTYSFGATANAYGFDFSIMFQGVSKYSKYYSGWGIFEENGSKYFNDFLDERWSAERYAAGEKITAPRLTNTASPSHVANSYYIMDASYLRLKNITLGYTIPQKITRKLRMSQIRFYVSAENLYTWQHLRTKSFDPEQSSLLDYPLLKTYTCGLNINF